MRKKYLKETKKMNLIVNSPGYEEYARKETILYDSHFEGFNRKFTILNLPQHRISDPNNKF
jgi:hypothetical protein